MIRGPLSVSLIAALALPSAALANHDQQDSSKAPQDFVSGGGKATSSTNVLKFGFTAHSGPSGENARGNYNFKIAPAGGAELGSFQGEVQCLDVDGNMATFAGQNRRGTGSFEAFPFVKVTVIDNGVPSDSMDAIAASTSSTPFDCDQPLTSFSMFTNGNAVVHDAQP